MIVESERAAFSIPEIAELIGVSDVHVRRLTVTGALGSVACGARRLVTRRQLNDYLERLEAENRTDDAA